MNIPLPTNIKKIEEKDNWAKFQIEGLYPGYGVTIGNSLRRALLSSLHGAAVTEVKIEGVSHEFTTISGVIEDVITIMMNLKKMRFKVFSEEPQIATLKIKGEKEIKSSDFKIPSQMELVTKDIHIATITNKSTELEIEVKIERGYGYQTREKREKGSKLEIGVIPVDAIFTPVKKVSFIVENMRVGDRTDFDRLNLELETDGTITPEDAFFGATEVLVDHFSHIMNSFKKTEGVKVKKEKVDDKVETEELKEIEEPVEEKEEKKKPKKESKKEKTKKETKK